MSSILFVVFIWLLNWTVITLYKNKKVNLMLSGICVLILAPIAGYLFVPMIPLLEPGTSIEAAAFSGAFFAYIMIIDGLIILGIGLAKVIMNYVKKH